MLKIGLSWPSLSKALGRPVHDPSRWAVLYLGSAKVADLDTDRDIVAINRKGEVEDNQRAHPEGYRRHRAARRHLEPGQGAVVAQCVDAEVPARHPRPRKQPSRYGKLRREPRRDGLSTIEAAAMLLAALEKRPDIAGDAECQFRADAGEISRGASRDAGTRAETEAEARLPPPQKGLTIRR